jgi:hypothetical protein
MWEHQQVDDRTGHLPRGTVTFLFTDIEGSDRPDPHAAIGDDAALAAAWAEGEAMSLAEAAALAIRLIDEGHWKVER